MFTKEKILSLIHTFIATFVTSFATIVVAIPADTFFNPKTWAASAVLAIVNTALRASVKAVVTSVTTPSIITNG